MSYARDTRNRGSQDMVNDDSYGDENFDQSDYY